MPLPLAEPDSRPAIAQADRIRLRELLARLAEYAASGENRRRIDAWTAHNDLTSRRPLMLVFPEGGWREIMSDEDLRCRDPGCRRFEEQLWQQLYAWEHFASDHPIAPEITVPMAIGDDGWGIQEHWRHSTSERGSRTFDPVIHSIEDLDALHVPQVHHDEAASARRLDWFQDIVGDLMPVRLVGVNRISFHLMKLFTAWRGLEETMMDMAVDPEFVHRGMELITQAYQGRLRQYQEMGLLAFNHDNTYHSSGGTSWTAELPGPDADPEQVRPQDLWASAECQELAPVSPRMHREFALRYEARLLAPFARSGYGCCEPLHDKLEDVLELLPNLRRVSISPWADVALSAERLGPRAIYSWKPQPAHLVGTFDPAAIADYIDHTLDVCAANDCVLEIILKDTHSCERHPERFDRWSRICREQIEARWD